ncbi:MAG: BatA domain-containing protein [Saprospiraceae bacterium]|nr:BatA domain-containing protein [Saprospiraceae bacterium]
MQFLYPAFLWALTLLSIPIILHLFYFRRYKKIYFSNLRFLREVKEETSARNRLRNLLILLSRLLAMAFIIFAFAQPFIPLDKALKAGIKNVSVFVDNSFSMQSFGKDLSLFDRARQKAREVISGYGMEDHFQVLGHDLSAAQHQWISRDEALIRLEEMDFTPLVKPLSVIYGRQKQSFAKEEGSPVSWMISDFQKSIFDLTSADSTQPVNMLPLIGVQEKNVAIDSAWFESPVQTLNQTSSLLFVLHNYAAEDANNIRVTIDLDGQERPEGTVDIAGKETSIDTAKITVLKTGWHTVSIRISDFPVTFDDTYFLTFYVAENLKVLSINEQADTKRITAAYANSDYFIVEESTAGNIPFARMPEFNLIILNGLTSLPSGLTSGLRKYVEDGGNVLFIPSATGDIVQYNSLMKSMSANEFLPWKEQERQVGTINTEAFIYNDVFSRTRPNMRLPKVKASFPYAGSGTKGQSLLTFRDGGDLATFYTIGKGAFCVLSSSLDDKVNDLVLQPEILVPLLYKLTIYASEYRSLAYTIGLDHLIPVDKTNLEIDKEMKITGPAEFIPGVSPLGSKILLDVQGQIHESGFYNLMQDDTLVAALAFNYDRKESDLTLTNLEEMAKMPGIKVWTDPEESDFTHLIESERQGKLLWKWCIILALMFIGLEIALIRLWKSQ